MKACPNVKSLVIEIHHKLTEEEWKHLSNVLKSNTFWHLYSIIYQYHKYDGVTSLPKFHLLDCAFHMRDNIQNMTLSRKMFDKRDIVCSHEFKQLEKLVILAHDWISNFRSCSGLIKYVPQLKELTIDFSKYTTSVQIIKYNKEITYLA